jgi:hypothetical protein
MPDIKLTTHRFVFNEQNNSGEGLSLRTDFYHNGDPGGIYTNQTLKLQSYCNSAQFELVGASITPELLRKLADQLELARQEALSKI